MQDNTGKKLRRIFDFQKFEKEPGLGGVINDTMSTSSGVRKLSDDELEYAAGGVGAGSNTGEPDSDFTIGNAFCPKCSKVMKVRIHSGGRGYCTKCNTEIDNI